MAQQISQGSRQMSEAFRTVLFLSLSGGLQDAYTYLGRGGVFANAQTGNIVFMGQSLFTGDWARFLHYLVPVLAFALGVAAAELIRVSCKEGHRLHWRQLVLLVEIALLFGVGFLPDALNLAANALVSFACAMQVQAFRKVHGYPFASTMCIGNLRSGMDALVAFGHTHDKNALWKSLHYFAIIFIFALGAGIGTQCVGIFGERTIWLSCALLLVSLCFMFIKEDLPEIEEELKK